MAQRRFHLVLNVHSGTVQSLGVTEDQLKDVFARNGLDLVVDADPEDDLSERIRKALASDADTVIAAGGDGTVTALASAIIDTDKNLAIIPLGTANLLARDLGVPLDMEECVRAIAEMEPLSIDVSEVNGTIFLHKAVIGMIPELAAGREHIRGKGFGATIGFLRYFLRRVSRAKRFAVEITTEGGGRRIERVQAIAVASNGYDEGLGRFFSKDRLDTGLLTLYIARHLNMGDMVRLATEMVAGRWRDDDALDISTARSITIRAKKPRLQAMIDGEVTSLEVPLQFKIYPRALSILAPVPVVAEELSQEQAQSQEQSQEQAEAAPHAIAVGQGA